MFSVLPVLRGSSFPKPLVFSAPDVERTNVKTNAEAKQTNILGKKDPLKTDKTKDVGDNTKEDDSENSKEKLKDISNTDKETQILKQNRHTFWGIKNLSKQTRQKTFLTTPKEMIVRTQGKTERYFKYRQRNL